VRGDGKPGRGGDELEQGQRRQAQLLAAIARVLAKHPEAKAGMAMLRKEMGL
jgi:hypothetical protein